MPDLNGNPSEVALLDLATCSKIKTLYVSQPNEGVVEAVLSAKGWLAITGGMKSGDIVLWVFDEQRNVKAVLPGARSPVWSPDGEWLAFKILNDGLYIARKDGSEQQELVDYGKPGAHANPGQPSWSPDGEWLAYSDTSGISKVNIATRQIVQLTQSGSSPSWHVRLTMPRAETILPITAPLSSTFP